MKIIKFKIRGVVPTIQHNGQTSDPLNHFAKEIKKISSKKVKTDDDYMEMARLEWFASLYTNDHEQIIWPAENIEKMIADAAKKTRQGKQTLAGIFIDGDTKLEYEGPKDPKKLWEFASFEKNPFVSRVSAVVKSSNGRIMRTRAIFRDWAVQFNVNYMEDLLSASQIKDFVNTAGTIIGLSDWRPKYGRFVVESVEE
jgi:hypothetical protein